MTRRRRRLATIAAAATAALAAVGCREAAVPARPNVLVVVVDALRADRLGCYGHVRPTSPRLDALAADAVRFDAAMAPAPWTLPSLATLWTSLRPDVHGAGVPSHLDVWMTDRRRFRPSAVLARSRTTLAEVLQRAGWRTIAVVNGSYPSRVFGFDQGFDEYHEDGEMPGTRLEVEGLLAALDRDRTRPFFAWLHLMSVHSPWTPPADDPRFAPTDPDPTKRAIATALGEERARYARWDFDPGYRGDVAGDFASLRRLHALADRHERPAAAEVAHLAALYDRGVAYTDFWIGTLLDGLRTRGLLDATIVVVTADHGDELFEHGGLEHERTFFEEVMRVPLLVRVPGGRAGRVVGDPVGLVDLFPTLLDLTGIAWDGEVQGRSLRPLLDGGALAAEPAVGEASIVAGRTALRTADRKLVREPDGTTALYDLAADPAETRDVCGERADECARLRAVLDAARTDDARRAVAYPLPEAATIDGETRDHLRALGYE